MLNIPDSIKTLFQRDGVKRNFRVHFPNGEFSDITNENIVRESLHFTESICSQDNFKFGLAEASVLEFETVGVGNMYGMTIEASIEIDTTSLSASQISTIQAGTWDGELVLAAASDIGYGFFRVPLGVFRVESCPRNHGAMAHRQVTAYSQNLGGGLSPLESWKQLKLWADASYSLESISSLIDANIAYNSPEYVAEHYTAEAVTITSAYSYLRRSVIFTWTIGATTYQLEAQYGTGEYSPTYAGGGQATLSKIAGEDMLFSVHADTITAGELATLLRAQLAADGVPTTYYYSATEKRNVATDAVQRVFSQLGIGQSNIGFSGIGFYYFDGNIDFALSTSETTAINLLRDARIAFNFTETRSGSVIRTKVYTVSKSASGTMEIEKLTPIDAIDVSVTINSTAQDASTGKYSYENAYTLKDIFGDVMELSAQFALVGRNGAPRVFYLTRTNEISIARNYYQDAWWDEYDVSAIGNVITVYKDGNEEITTQIEIGDGESVYDLSENKFLREIRPMTLAEQTTYLTGEFKANCVAAAFTPIELTMQGWPWLEAGDAIAFTAEDGTTVESYALRVEMSGIQYMTAIITAQGGEIINPEADEEE